MKTKPRKSRSTRKHRKTRKRGGSKNELLKFRYTRNPGRAAWTEALYPLGPEFFRLINSIPWNTYEYNGPTEASIVTLTELNWETKYDIAWSGDVTVKAKPISMPYSVLGGAACEIYNLHFKGAGFPNLYDTTDPTGDIDCRLARLDIEATPPQNQPVQNNQKLILYEIAPGNNPYQCSKVYDDYSRWLFNQVCEKLRRLQPFVSDTTKFAPKTKEGNNEMAHADLEQSVGNFLVTRARVSNMIKVQVGLGVRYNGGIKQEHCIEFILPINETIDDLAHQAGKIEHNYIMDNHRINRISDVLPFGINLVKIKPLILSQADALVNRGKEMYKTAAEARNAGELNSFLRDYGHKSYNHYGRLVYLLRLLLHLINTNQHPQVAKADFYLVERDLLERSGLNTKNIPVCFPRCDFNLLRQLLGEVTAYRISGR
jgi:hypothetical protein